MTARSDADLVAALVETVRRFDTSDRGRTQPLRQRVLALDTARAESTPLELPLQGNFLYADDDTDGKLYVRLGDEEAPRIPVGPGFVIGGLDFRRVYLDWSAQPGKVVNLVYGIGANLQPPTIVGNINSIGSIASAVDITDYALRKVLAGEVYSIGTGVNAVVSQYGVIGLVNQSADKNLVVLSARAGYTGDYAAVHLFANTEAVLETFPGSTAGVSHFIGNAASAVGDIWAGQTATANDRGTMMTRGYVSPNLFTEFCDKAPIIVPPDKGLALATGGTELAFAGSFTWVEVDA